MKKKDRAITRHLILNTILVILFLFGVLLFSRYESYNRQMTQNNEYISELSSRTSQHISDVLESRKDALESIAYLYGQAPADDISVDRVQLAQLEQNSGFDFIRFITPEGESYSSGGKIADVNDREYYRLGITGNSGIDVVLVSRFNQQCVIGCYAPVYREGKICGVLAGFLSEDTMARILETELYGYSTDTMIVNSAGAVLGQGKDDQLTSLFELLDSDDVSQRLTIQNALDRQLKTRCILNDGGRETVCYLVPIAGTNWMLFQRFPAEATRVLLERTEDDEQLILLLFGLAALWFIFQCALMIHKKSALSHEAASRNRVLTLLQSVADDYVCLIDVNLKTETEEQFRLHAGVELDDWSGGNYDYTHSVESYALKFVAPQDRARFMEATRLPILRKVLAQQKDFFLEYDATIDGVSRHLQSKFSLSRTDANRMLVSIRDITEVTRERQRTQLRLELLLSATNTVYPFILEENLTRNHAYTISNENIVRRGRVENGTLDELMEHLHETIPYDSDFEQLSDVLGREQLIEAYHRGERERSVRVRQLGDDGKLHWMETRNILMTNLAGDICAISMTRCIDDEIQMTTELQTAKEAAESSSRAKSAFLFNMSHDIRTPMNAIIGFSAMAEKYCHDPEKVTDCLKKINYSGEYLLKLINSVLDMARIESGKTELQIQAYDILTTARSVEYIFHADLKRKNLDFKVDIDVQDNVVFFDLLKINEIKLNLISNAIKYTPDGGSITYEVRQLGAKADVGTYRIIVRDTGIGMSPEFCARVFDPFERENSSIVSGVEGTGLGLTITKRLVEELGGSITCRSTQGKGSEFICIFTFPIGSPSDLAQTSESDSQPLHGAGRRILLVEDNALNREISHEILTNDGFLVEDADDGDVAVDKVKWSTPGYYDLVLMDIQMPRMNGYEATRQIRALDDPALAQIPIVALTANAFEEDRRNALEAGMNAHIGKPIDIAKLRQVLRDLLDEPKK